MSQEEEITNIVTAYICNNSSKKHNISKINKYINNLKQNTPEHKLIIVLLIIDGLSQNKN